MRTRLLAVSVTVLLLLVGCSSSGSDDDRNGSGSSTSTTRRTTTTRERILADPDATTTTDADDDTDSTVTWNRFTFTVPPGYALHLTDDGEPACIATTAPVDANGHCTGLQITVGDALDHATNGQPYDPTKGDFAWWPGGDVPPCDPTADETALVTSSTPGIRNTQTLGDHRFAYATWSLTCDNGMKGIVEQWYLADEELLLTNRTGTRMSPIVASLEID